MKLLVVLSLLLSGLSLNASYRYDDKNIEIEKQRTKTISLNSSGYKSSLQWEGDISLDVYRLHVDYVPYEVPITTEICDTYNYGSAYNYDTKEGRAWAAFYGDTHGVSGYKQSQLAEAIKGVNKRAAQLYPYFRQGKPKTWSDFKSLISRIERRENLKGLYGTVINHWGSENKRNLGYNRSVGTNCYDKITGYDTLWLEETTRDKIDTLIQKFRMEVDNASYLPGESDSISLIFSGYNYRGEALADIKLPNRSYNSFQKVQSYMDGNNTIVFELRAQRNLVKAPNTLTINNFKRTGNSKLSLNVQDSGFFAEPKFNSKKSIKVEVWKNSPWWNPFDFDDKLTTTTINLDTTKATTSIEISVPIEKGSEIYLVYSQIIDNSEFYQHGEGSSKKTSKKVLD
jgi:hypothetical protein